LTLEEFANLRFASIVNETWGSLSDEFWDNELLDLRAGFKVFLAQHYTQKANDAKKAMKAMKAMKAN
jgi:hypothetical protein